MLRINGFGDETIELIKRDDDVHLVCSDDEGSTVTIEITKNMAIQIIRHLAKQFQLDKPNPRPANFQIGHKVTNIKGEVGVVVDDNDNASMDYKLAVKLGNNKKITFTTDGKQNYNDTTRSLFHGDNIMIIVLDEETPKKVNQKWVNLYQYSNDDIATCGITFESEAEAKDYISDDCGRYIKTTKVSLEK
jgi:hypothetical protein